MSNDKIVKVYCFFLKSDPNELYAFTINKMYKELFEEQRCTNKFVCGTKKMTDTEFRIFSYKNSDRMLHKEILTDDTEIYEVLATADESNKFSDSCSYIADVLMSLESECKSEKSYLYLSKNHLEFIYNLTDILIHDKTDKSFLNINTFKLFLYLFKETMYDSGDVVNDEHEIINNYYRRN